MLASLGSRVVQEVVPQYRAADALAGLQTRPQRKGAHLGRHHRFETAAGTKLHGRALIHCHQNGLFPVFVKELGVGSARARRDAPVDRADVVSGRIGAHLIKFDATASLARAAHAREVGERTGLAGHIDEPRRESGGDQALRGDNGTARTGHRFAPVFVRQRGCTRSIAR